MKEKRKILAKLKGDEWVKLLRSIHFSKCTRARLTCSFADARSEWYRMRFNGLVQ